MEHADHRCHCHWPDLARQRRPQQRCHDSLHLPSSQRLHSSGSAAPDSWLQPASKPPSPSPPRPRPRHHPPPPPPPPWGDPTFSGHQRHPLLGTRLETRWQRSPQSLSKMAWLTATWHQFLRRLEAVKKPLVLQTLQLRNPGKHHPEMRVRNCFVHLLETRPPQCREVRDVGFGFAHHWQKATLQQWRRQRHTQHHWAKMWPSPQTRHQQRTN
mmetsp:Transcript_81511/g.179263  ORF Transcript_81511/g.179263 Transcript_81511/m.179263 type:complete len:213 (-) Transcript_81511:24-662(-)